MVDDPSEASLDALYRYCARFGTTLQVPEDRWPGDRNAFDEYWGAGLERIEVDDVTKPYLLEIANLDFIARPFGGIGRPVAWTFGPLNRFLTTGFLHPPFREALGLPWSERHQRAFDRVAGGAAALIKRLPRPLRTFPFNLYLADVRRRVRAGRAIV
jgi:uncharacterized protein (DUF2236 family)